MREFAAPDDGVKFEWRRTPTQDYEVRCLPFFPSFFLFRSCLCDTFVIYFKLFAPSDCRIASYTRVAYQTKAGGFSLLEDIKMMMHLTAVGDLPWATSVYL